MVTVQWEDEDEFAFYTEGDARYKVDTNLWRITPPKDPSIFDIIGGKVKRPKNPALTTGRGDGSIAASPREGASAMTEEDAMPKTKSGKKAGKTHKIVKDDGAPKGVPVDDDEIDDLETSALDDELDDVPTLDEAADELDDELEEDEVDTPAPVKKGKKKAAPKADLPARETYTAKQVATRIGTDSKSLRKFFRSPASTVEPVGQGGRYEFDAADLPKIQAEFDAWKAKKPVRGAAKPKGEKPKGRQAPANATVVEADDEIDDIEEEPDADELAALEDDDLDLSLDDDEEDD